MLCLYAAGCKPRSEEAAPAVPEVSVSEGKGSVADADLTSLLAEMTQAVRKYGFEKQKVPTSLDELVTAGYLATKPVAPSGKKFTIDPKTMQVVVVSN